MGVRFNLATVNWLAYLLDPNKSLPRMASTYDERDSLIAFLQRLPKQFRSSSEPEQRALEELTENTLGFIRNFPPAQRIPEDFFSPLQQLLSSDHTWIGLIIPSRQDKELDRLLCSNRLLDHLIYKVRWGSPGILL